MRGLVEFDLHPPSSSLHPATAYSHQQAICWWEYQLATPACWRGVDSTPPTRIQVRGQTTGGENHRMRGERSPRPAHGGDSDSGRGAYQAHPR